MAFLVSISNLRYNTRSSTLYSSQIGAAVIKTLAEQNILQTEVLERLAVSRFLPMKGEEIYVDAEIFLRVNNRKKERKKREYAVYKKQDNSIVFLRFSDGKQINQRVEYYTSNSKLFEDDKISKKLFTSKLVIMEKAALLIDGIEKSHLQATMEVLSTEGIGADRSTGKCYFKFEKIETVSLKKSKEGIASGDFIFLAGDYIKEVYGRSFMYTPLDSKGNIKYSLEMVEAGAYCKFNDEANVIGKNIVVEEGEILHVGKSPLLEVIL
jgi:CRISPR/Cas system CSM-associated protein Csm4 (group 5 of RAMP superfamily)